MEWPSSAVHIHQIKQIIVQSALGFVLCQYSQWGHVRIVIENLTQDPAVLGPDLWVTVLPPVPLPKYHPARAHTVQCPRNSSNSVTLTGDFNITQSFACVSRIQQREAQRGC